MEKPFIQELLNASLFRKITSAFSFLRKEKLNEKDLADAMRELDRGGLISALRKSKQNPDEVVEMTLIAFDESTKLARTRLENLGKQLVEHYKKQNASS